MKPRQKTTAAPAARSFRHLWTALGLCAIALAAYLNSFSTGFALDNKPLILQDPRVHEATSENVGLILQHTYWWPIGEAGLYRPLTTLSYLFNYAILGNADHPEGYHWFNFLLHAVNICLVYALALRLVRRYWPAVFIAGLWAVHPLATEAVTNIVGRADLMAATAVLGGLLLYLKSAEATGPARFVWLAGLFALTLAGVFSKESAVIVIGAIALYEFTWWRERGNVRAIVMGAIAVFIPLEILLYRRSFVLAGSPPADFPFTDNPIVGADFWTGRLTALKVMAHDLWLAVCPIHLSADYSYNQIPLVHGSAGDWFSLLVMLAAAAGVVYLYWRNRTAFFLAAFAFLTLLPASNLLFPIGAMMAERFLYLPAVGLLGCLVLGVFAVAERFGAVRAATIALSLLACAFVVRTWLRNPDWQDDVTLARATVQASPLSFKSHEMLAVALFEADPNHADVDSVLDEARTSIAILDPLPDIRSEAGIYRLAGACYLTRGDRLRQKGAGDKLIPTPASIEAYRSAIPVLTRGVAILNAARAEREKKRAPRAKGAPVFEPSSNDDIYRLLSVAYLRLGDGDKAFDLAVEGRNKNPLNPEVYAQMGDVLEAAGEAEQAAVALMEGMLVTTDLGLRSRLLDLYRSGLDRQGCAVVTGPNGPAINPACEMVHRDLCAASVDSVKISLFTGRRNTAKSLKQSFLHDYGCPAGPLNEVLPDGGS